jgi:hypothetical protein
MTEPTWVGTVQSFSANWFLQKIKPGSKKSSMESEKSQIPFANLMEVTFFQHIVCQVSDHRYGMKLTRPEAKFLVPDWGTRLHGLVVQAT